ncbi:unnamed protein product [Lampetra fluviatilis]
MRATGTKLHVVTLPRGDGRLELFACDRNNIISITIISNNIIIIVVMIDVAAVEFATDVELLMMAVEELPLVPVVVEVGVDVVVDVGVDVVVEVVVEEEGVEVVVEEEGVEVIEELEGVEVVGVELEGVEVVDGL